MTDQEVQQIADRIAQGLEGLAPPARWWFDDDVTPASLAVLIVVLMFATVSSLTLRHQHSILQPILNGRNSHTSRQRWGGPAADLWWSRAQWALGATASSNQKMYFYGMVILQTLVKSNAVSSNEKAMLDTVWEASSTGMDDVEISRFLENFQMRASQAAKGRSDPAPIGTGHPDAAPAEDPPAYTMLRREILAAQLKVALDEELHRHTSLTVEQLASLQLPPIV